MPKLTIHHADSKQVDHDINGDLVTVGRKRGNAIVITDKFISGKHSEFHRKSDDKFELIDLGSHNGTFVNGKRIERAILKDGDKIGFGTLKCVFTADNGTAAAAPATKPSKKTTKIAASAPPKPGSAVPPPKSGAQAGSHLDPSSAPTVTIPKRQPGKPIEVTTAAAGPAVQVPALKKPATTPALPVKAAPPSPAAPAKKPTTVIDKESAPAIPIPSKPAAGANPPAPTLKAKPGKKGSAAAAIPIPAPGKKPATTIEKKAVPAPAVLKAGGATSAKPPALSPASKKPASKKSDTAAKPPAPAIPVPAAPDAPPPKAPSAGKINLSEPVKAAFQESEEEAKPAEASLAKSALQLKRKDSPPSDSAPVVPKPAAPPAKSAVVEPAVVRPKSASPPPSKKIAEIEEEPPSFLVDDHVEISPETPKIPVKAAPPATEKARGQAPKSKTGEDVVALKARLDKLEGANKDLVSQKSALEKQITELETRDANRHKQNAEKDRELEDLRKKAEAFAKEKTEAAAIAAAAPVVLQAQLAPDDEQDDEQEDELKAEIKALESDKKELALSLEKRTREFEEKLSRNERETEQAVKQAGKLEIKVQGLEERSQERTDEHRAETAALETELDQFKIAQRESDQLLAAAEKETAKMGAALEESRAQVDKLNSELREMKLERAKTPPPLPVADPGLISELRNQVERLESKSQDLEKINTELAANHEAQIGTLREEIEQLKTQRQESQDALAAEKAKVEEMSAKSGPALTDVSELEKTLAAADEKAKGTATQLAAIQKEVDDLKAQRREAQIALEAEKKKIPENTAADIKRLKEELADARAKAGTITDRKAGESEAEISALRTELENMEAERVDSEKSLAGKRRETEEALSKTKDALAAANARADRLSTELTDTKEKLSKAETKAATATREAPALPVPEPKQAAAESQKDISVARASEGLAVAAKRIVLAAPAPGEGAATTTPPTPIGNLGTAETTPPRRTAAKPPSFHELELKTLGIVPGKKPIANGLRLEVDLPGEEDVVLVNSEIDDQANAWLKKKNLEDAEAALKQLEDSLQGKK